MQLKGDLDSIGLAELFKTLADQKANGVLYVNCTNGEKLIFLAAGEISVCSDRLSERSRLGDLLVVRGQLTDEKLGEALKVQRTQEIRARLGDVLVKHNFVKATAITEALKFQLEEEIFDLFTWKNATFEFDSEKTIDDMCSEDICDDNMTSVKLDTQQLIAEANRRMPDWKVIEGRLPTSYLCFKFSPKGDEQLANGSRMQQHIAKFLKEGRTVETTVKRSCMGRFIVSKTIIKMLDDGWIFPYPAGELRFLASEHRASKRYTDALNIYRRMLEATEHEADRVELEKMINDTVEAIHRANAAGESVEGLEIFSHKAAAERYKRRQRNRHIGMVGFCVVSFVVIGLLLVQRFQPPPGLSNDYISAIRAADAAVDAKKFDDAIKIWDDFLATVHDKTSETARLATDRLKVLPDRKRAFLEAEVQSIELIERADKLAEAEAAYKKLMADYPEGLHIARINDALARIAAKRKTRTEDEIRVGLETRAKELREIFEQRQYTAAKQRATALIGAAPDGSQLRRDAEEILRKLQEIQDRSSQALKVADGELKDHKGENAIKSYELVYSEWPDLPWADMARLAAQRLKLRLDTLKRDMKQAENIVAQGGVHDGLQMLQQLDREYAEFELVGEVKRRMASLSTNAGDLEKQLTEAQEAALTDRARARLLFAKLLRNNPSLLSSRNAEVPVRVTSHPTGAVLKIDGKPIGTTPQEIMLPTSKAVVLRLERDGYTPLERNLPRLLPEDLDMQLRLKREALATQELRTSIHAPPRVINGVLYVLHGTSLSALDPEGRKVNWTLNNLFDDKQTSRPNSSGAGPNHFVDDKTWWYPRSAPEQIADDKLMLALRTREIIEISLKEPSFRSVLVVPTEPVGSVYLERASLMAGKPLLAVGTADGKVRVYDPAKASTPLWEKASDPTTPAPRGAVISGVVSRPGGTFLALSASGRLALYNLVNGAEVWSLELKAAMADTNQLPRSHNEKLVPLVHADGKVTLVDIVRGEKMWELPVAQALDEAMSAAVDANGVYIVTRDGVVKKYPRDRSNVKPAMIWQRPMDGAAELPLAIGKALYAVSTFGTIYAINPADGQVVWDFRDETKPNQIVPNGELLYLTNTNGKLLVLKAD